MAYRKFYFENGVGDIYQLTDKNYKHFLNTPSGLGFDKKYSSVRLGNNEIITTESYELPNPSGELIFYDPDKSYKDYYDFISFISKTPITFYYIPPNEIDPYYIDCIVTSCSKEEITYDDQSLRCPISIHGTSMWKTSKVKTLVITDGADEYGKEYNLVRDYRYSGKPLSNIEIYNDGSVECGFILELIGEVRNPQISIYDSNNDRYGLLKVTGDYTYIRVNTTDKDRELYLENNGSSIALPTSYIDWSVSDGKSIMPFFKFKLGRSKVVFTNGLPSFEGTIRFSWSKENISV